MDITSLIATQVIPLYLIVLIGFFGARFLEIEPKNISRFVIYLISPFIVFEATMKVPFHIDSFTPPLFYALISALITGLSFAISHYVLRDKNRMNIFAVASSVKNSGYFGIPIALVVFPPEISNIYIIATLGGVLLEVTVNFYILARHSFTAQDSILKLLKLPALYAFILGVFLNSQGIEIPLSLDPLFGSFKGTLIILGMAIIGLNIAQLDRFKLDFKLLTPTLCVHIFIWPLITYALLYLDFHYTHLILSDYHALFILVAFLPVAVNVTIYASELNVMPESAATLVLISTLLAVVLVPLALYLIPILQIDTTQILHQHLEGLIQQ